MDLPGDSGPLVQRRRLGLRRPCRPFLCQKALRASTGLGVQTQHVPREAEPGRGHGRGQPVIGVHRGVRDECHRRGRDTCAEWKPLQRGHGAAAPEHRRGHLGPRLLRPERRKHQQEQQAERGPQAVLQAGPEEGHGDRGASCHPDDAGHDLPRAERSIRESPPEHQGDQPDRPHQPADDGPRPRTGLPRECLLRRPARPGSGCHTRSFHVGRKLMPSADPRQDSGISAARRARMPPRTSKVTARAVIRAGAP